MATEHARLLIAASIGKGRTIEQAIAIVVVATISSVMSLLCPIDWLLRLLHPVEPDGLLLLQRLVWILGVKVAVSA